MSETLLITNARLVNEGREFDADLLVVDGRIARIAGSISAPAGARVMDASGCLLLPGMIDDQVHFREPGLTHKGDLASESAAAVAGGTTSFMEMPNVSPQTTTREAIAAKYALAATKSHGNYAFYFGATNHNIEEIRALRPGDACGVKIFMGASTGDMLVHDPAALEAIFADSPLLIATHCEDSPTIWANERAARERWGEDVPLAEHANIRSAEACWKSSSLAVELARRFDARLHVLHLTTAREMALFDAGGDPATKRITAEACVHHLWFCDEDYARLGTHIKCNPAIKSAADRAALREAVIDGRIDVIATDHAPHLLAEKDVGYFRSAAGLPLVQHALQSLLEQVREGTFTLPLVVEKIAHAPARMFAVRERGYLREGYWADLVVVDPRTPHRVTRDSLLYRCGWSPFEDVVFSHSIRATVVSGQVAWENGQLNRAVRGQRLDVTASR